MHLDLTRNIKEISMWLIFINTLSMKGDFFGLVYFGIFKFGVFININKLQMTVIRNKSNYTEESFLMLCVQGT